MDTLAVQSALAALGYAVAVDGKSGPKTKAAIVAFQRKAGLYPDGIVGPKTILALRVPGYVSNEPAPVRQAMSTIGLATLVGREALKTEAYLDSVGIWTIGVGHTAAAGAPIPYKGLVISREEALAVFSRDLQSYEDAVRDAVKVPLADHQFDALASICFNIGQGGFKSSSFVKRINAGGSASQIRAAILAWRKPAEIISRRTAEADQFQTPYSASLPKARSTDTLSIKLAA